MNDAPRPVMAAMLIIGNEILSGRTRDVNLSHFAERLAMRGIRLGEARVVRDEPAEIVGAVNAMRAAYDLVFTTGGIGPTHDDITADCVAEAFGVPIGEHPEAVAILERHYGVKTDFTPARRRMARVPQGARLIPNPVSAAPGFIIGNVYVMAGVPRIARAMLEAVFDALPQGVVNLTATVAAAVAEGRIADRLRMVQERFPAVEIGSYPQYESGRQRTAVVLKCADAAMLADAKAEVLALMRAEGVEPEPEPAQATN